MNRKFGITVAVALTIASVSIVGVIVGVVLHEEETFLRTCLPQTEGNELLTSVHEDHCPVVHWEESDFPLCVVTRVLKGANPPPEFRRSVSDAISSVNGNFKRKIFLLNGQGKCATQNPAVAIYGGQPHERHWFEAAGHVTFGRMKSTGRIFSEVYVGNTPSDGVLHYVLMHELGHVLFLAHDEYPSSIMYHEVGDPFFLTKNLKSVLAIQHFSDTDVAAVLEQYPNLPSL